MKKNIIILTAILILSNIMVIAQTPEKMSYQAVIRNSSNALVTNQSVGMKISILHGSVNGSAVYEETHTTNTNINGLVSITIGDGTVLSGSFSAIDWSNGPYFVKSETDPSGGTSYSITGTSQLLSVPYALHAKAAEAIIGGGSIGNDFYLGQDTLGGIVFHIYIGSDGMQHGLIVSKNEGSPQAWQSTIGTTNAIRSWDGNYNTALMTNSPSANYVNGLTDGGFSDWYLPSIDELSLLWHNRYHVNNKLNALSATLLSHYETYWSSTEYGGSYAFCFSFYSGDVFDHSKSQMYKVRAIRSF